jgi:hypothetical protein
MSVNVHGCHASRALQIVFGAMALAALLSACVVDGAYAVRGTVRATAPGGDRPVRNVHVVVRGVYERGVASRVPYTAYTTSTTNDRGEYDVSFKGPPSLRRGDVQIEFQAEGFPPVRTTLLRETDPERISRTLCTDAKYTSNCWIVDVRLTSGEAAPER